MCKDDLDRIEKWAAISLTLLLTLTLCGPAVAQSGPTFHANGNFADGFSCSPPATTVECISVSVFGPGGPTGIPGQTATFLFYDDFIFDPNTGIPIQDTNGSGLIPNSAFQVHGKTDSLNVDTSKVPNFDNEFCTFDQFGNPTCNPAQGGIVTGTWNAIATLLNFQFSGTTRQVFPGVTFISTGTSNFKPALTSLSVLGVVATNATGDIGQEHNTFITVQRH
jgi:hypothetical protein